MGENPSYQNQDSKSIEVLLGAAFIRCGPGRGGWKVIDPRNKLNNAERARDLFRKRLKMQRGNTAAG